MHQVQKEFQIIEPRRTSVPDRIGGNGFAGGLFYGLLKGWDLKKCVKFGWSAEH
jgi:2-dehydro-3-deoxygluconokinase